MRKWSKATLLVVALLAPILQTDTPASAAPPANASRFVPVDPDRVLDTRTDAPVAAGGRVVLDVTSKAPVPAASITAVVLNVTAVDANPGFVQVYPTGAAVEGTSSNINVEVAGQTIPNLVVVPVGTNGSVTLFSQSGGHLVADLFGYFVAASSATDGRYLAVTPDRLLDTRTQAPGKLSAGGSVKVQVRGKAGVPATGVRAAVLNVTATDATAPGFVQVIPTGGTTAIAASSNLNVGRAGQTIPNLVIVPLGADGTVTVYSQTGTHLLVDVMGYFTDGTVAAGEGGLFVPVTPDRQLDTRRGAKPAAGTHTVVNPLGRSSVPTTGVTAVFGNVTATQAAPGWVQLLPGASAASEVGRYSNVNIDRADQTIPNAAVANLGTDGTIDLYTSASAHLLFDVAGWFTAEPPPPAALTVAVTTPTTLSGNQTITAATTGDGVLGVQFKLNGVDFGAEDTAAPYTAQWITARVPNGTYTLSAVVRTATESRASTPRTVQVSNAIVTLTFDDGWDSHLYAAQELASRNMAGTFYAMSRYASAEYPAPYLSLAQLLQMKNMGHEIGSHTVDHADLTTLTPEQLTTELTESKTVLEAAGLGPITNFATPYGNTNAAVTTAIKSVYGSQRTIDEGVNLPADRTNFTVESGYTGFIDSYKGWSAFDPYNLNVRNILGADVGELWHTKTTTATVQGWLDDIRARQAMVHTAEYRNNAWMIIVFHEITDTPHGGQDYTATPAEFRTYLDLIEASGVRVLTMQQALVETSTIAG